MKFSMGADDLSRTLQSVVSAVPPKSTLPILSNFLLEAKEGELMLTCTDLDMAVCTRTPSSVKDVGKVTVPARRFTEIVKELPSSEISVASEELRITLDCNIGQFTLMGMDAEEFPKLPKVDEGAEILIPAPALGRAIRYTAYAVGTDDARPVLNGVLVELRKGELRLAATDGHRLARVSVADSSLKGSANPIIVPRTLQLVQRLIGDSSEPVKLVLSDKYAIFEIGSTTIYSRLIDGPYPNYEQVIPKDNPNKLVVSRSGLIAAVRRVSILSDSITHQIKLELKANQVDLRVETADVGEGSETVEADYDGKEMTVGFNASYLMEALKGMDSDKVLMALGEPSTAVVIQPATQVEDEDILCLVMPIKIME
jgi:DNA polymerase-3 subunit beta